jgi:hypothetical protein
MVRIGLSVAVREGIGAGGEGCSVSGRRGQACGGERSSHRLDVPFTGAQAPFTAESVPCVAGDLGEVQDVCRGALCPDRDQRRGPHPVRPAASADRTGVDEECVTHPTDFFAMSMTGDDDVHTSRYLAIAETRVVLQVEDGPTEREMLDLAEVARGKPVGVAFNRHHRSDSSQLLENTMTHVTRMDDERDAGELVEDPAIEMPVGIRDHSDANGFAGRDARAP